MEKPLTQMTDKALMRSAVRGDHNAFNEIVRRYTRPLAEFAAARTTIREDAEDVVQESFLLAYRYLHSFDERYPLKNWLFTIVYRQLISFYRKKQTVRLSEDTMQQLAAPQAAPTPHAWLWDTARMMSQDMFTALWLKYKQDMSVAEVAHVMQKSQTSVRVLLHRARKQLAREIVTCPAKKAEERTWKFHGNTCLERTK
jgi:RNA polymerase sigma-70 factor (ECF subfamily)